MDVARLKKNDINVWLPLFEKVAVQCRYIGQREFDKILAETTETHIDFRTSAKTETRDERKFRSVLAQAVVKDWRGIVDGKEPFACVPENIDYLVEECTEFRILVMDAPLSLSRMLAAEKAALVKNC